LAKASKNIQGEMERVNLHQKCLRSVDEERDIIYKFGQMWLEQDMNEKWHS